MHQYTPNQLAPEHEWTTEWSQRRRERVTGSATVLMVSAAALILGDGWLLPPQQVAILGLLLFSGGLLALLVTPARPRLGALVEVATTLLAAGLAIRWLPGAHALAVIPVGLAAFCLGRVAGAGMGILVSALLLLPGQALPAPPTVAVLVAVLLCNLTALAGWLVETRQQTLFAQLFGFYRQAQQLLEAARDQRLLLNQANQDLTEAYNQVARLNELLRASQAETETARRAKAEFVANVSHELRTPLNMIIGFSEVILNAPAAYHQQHVHSLRADMGVIYRNSQHLAQLINDVLDLSQIEAGQLTLHREQVNLVEVAQEAIQAVEPLYRSKQLTLTVQSPPSLPPVICDRLRIRQILLNLLSNAGRFTLSGGATVALGEQAGAVEIAVRDSGPGIHPDDLRKIFEPFQQVDGSTRRPHDGSGLGLSISRKLVELHGGRMGVESTVGVGSVFHFSLPFLENSTSQTPIVRWFNPYSTYTPRTRRPVAELAKPPAQIIVLEQADVMCHQVRAYLRNVDVVGVRTVDELRAALITAAPSAILINDIQVMADWGLIRRTLALPARTPVISCYVPGIQEACERLNVVDYLIKPITSEKLLAALAGIAPAQSTLLVVEDNVEMAHLLTRQLAAAEQAYRLLRAVDGERGLVLLRERQPAALLLDLGLPDQDGYQVLQAKNDDPTIRDIPVLIISARDPLGQPVVTNRIRLEMADGLSVRDILLSSVALSQALSPVKRLIDPTDAETLPG